MEIVTLYRMINGDFDWDNLLNALSNNALYKLSMMCQSKLISKYHQGIYTTTNIPTDFPPNLPPIVIDAPNNWETPQQSINPPSVVYSDNTRGILNTRPDIRY